MPTPLHRPSIAIASFREVDGLEHTLRAVAAQTAPAVEVVVARAGDDIDELSARHPQVRFLAFPVGTALPVLRGQALAAASGDPVALTEDHCVPEPGWLEALAAARATGAEVVGGGMSHSRSGRLIEWGAYFSEYGFFSHARPLAPGLPLITGANVAYARPLVAEVAGWMTAGAWENVVHDRLAARGTRFAFTREARVQHRHRYQFPAFCADRYQHGRDYARDRLRELGANRWARAVITPLLPLALFLRVARAAAAESRAAFWAASPYTLAFLTAWSVGEAAGNLLGPRPRPGQDGR